MPGEIVHPPLKQPLKLEIPKVFQETGRIAKEMGKRAQQWSKEGVDWLKSMWIKVDEKPRDVLQEVVESPLHKASLLATQATDPKSDESDNAATPTDSQKRGPTLNDTDINPTDSDGNDPNSNSSPESELPNGTQHKAGEMLEVDPNIPSSQNQESALIQITQELDISSLTELEQSILKDMLRRATIPENHTNPAKRAQRVEYLREHPTDRIQINIQLLKKLMPEFYQMKCNPRSSVAYDLAMKGSDIDGGLVITNKTTSHEQQSQFITELRRQGFTCYHPTEIMTMKDEVAAAEVAYKKKEISVERLNEIRRHFLDTEGQILHFSSKEELRMQLLDQLKSDKGRLTPIIETYLSGKTL